MPDGLRVYAIGDIHGRADLLDELHHMIRDDAAGWEGDRIIVYLGDYIDRGMHNRDGSEHSGPSGNYGHAG